ncbi:hypothetical protein ET475_07755 [Microbacterium protaetiae]|uniref:DUF916 domain-containing protein n=1 Tax=Microbacterium protaetiae TaxID=2509458 RepID=A0A4P6EIB0_9MICO|nr:hypothetical protein [Microbacterium protaetiae]QAY59897.1 hypothetical protein ET475_07755 [Microbacterium protaetiae]
MLRNGQGGRRRAKVLAAAITALVVAGLVLPTSAWAAQSDDDSDTVTWSVQPAGETGADGRAWAELTLDPGEKTTDYLVVTNHSSRDVTFRLSAADGYFTGTGRFNMLPMDRQSVDAGTWIDVQPSVRVAHGGEAVVPFTIDVPQNATPGDHLAGVAAGILSDADSGEVGVESRVGFRVMTRVMGELVPQIETDVSAVFVGSINPFLPGEIHVRYDIQNTGNVRLGAAPEVTVAGPLGILPRTVVADPIAEIAPGEHRTSSVTVPSQWPFFVSTIRLATSTSSVSDAAPIDATPSSVSTVAIAAMPWSQLAVLLFAALLMVVWRRSRRRQMAEVERRIDQARAEGRSSASVAPGTES